MQNDQSTLQLSHQFPELGSVRIPLHQESRQLHEALEQLSSSGFRRLEKLDHLGELRNVLHCGHHSRYEYLMLQLYLIHFLKQHARAIGLSTEIPIGNRTVVTSGEELLKCWAMLSEHGHLYGTYEAERFVLKLVVQRDDFRAKFLELIDDSRIRRQAEHTLSQENLWRFYRFLSWIFLRRSEINDGNQVRKAALTLGLLMMRGLLEPAKDNTKLGRCQKYFERIRKLSYLYLDLARLPVHLKFSPSILFQELEKKPELFLESENSQFQRLLNSVQQMLLDEIYASPAANLYKLERVTSLERKLERELVRNPAAYTKSADTLFRWLHQARGSQIWKFSGNTEPWKHILRLRFTPDGYFSRSPCLIFKEQKRLEESTKSDHWAAFVSDFKSDLGEGSFLDVFERRQQLADGEGYLIAALLDHVRNAYSEIAGIAAVFEWLADEHLVEILLLCLKRFIRPNLYVRLQPMTSHDPDERQVKVIRTESERTKWSRSVAWHLRRENARKERRWESDCLRREVRRAPRGTLLVANCNVTLEDQSHKRIAELDGIFFRVFRGNIEATIVEAKTSKRAAQKSVEQLTDTLKKICGHRDEIKSLVKKCKRSAVATIPISMARKWAA